MTLFGEFLDNTDQQIYKWTHYFPIYERHFSAWKNRSLMFLEIGVYRGGSLQMWQKYFGPYATVVGIDIDPRCKRFERPGTHIRIGDQGDSGFLQSIVDEFGCPDVVLDDGSHKMRHVNASFDFLYPLLPKNGLYMVEDMHTAYWKEYGGGVDDESTFLNRCKGFTDQLNAAHSRGTVRETEITQNTLGISFYDSIVVLERSDVHWKEAIKVGG